MVEKFQWWSAFWQGFGVGWGGACACWLAGWLLARRLSFDSWRKPREPVKVRVASMEEAQRGFRIPAHSSVAVPMPPALQERISQLRAEGHSISFEQRPSINFEKDRLIEFLVFSDGEEIARAEICVTPVKE
jgi:hypothetical protein